MRLKVSSNITTTAGYNIIALDTLAEQNVKNNSLLFDSKNNAIKIGSGVHHIEITGQLGFNTITSGLKSVDYKKNTDTIAYNQAQMGGRYTALTGTTFITSVSENDLIGLEGYFSENDKIESSQTFLQVKVLD